MGIFSFGQIELKKENSTMMITGTSSLHDWEMEVNEFDVTGTISDATVKNLNVTVTAKSMKSGKSIMDGKAYDAVKADDYASIVFSATQLAITGKSISGQGSLMIGGETRPVELIATIEEMNGAEWRIVGSLPLKMKDFNIEPPTAMFGTLKTGNEVIIKYDITITN